ncbi:MAG: SUMF1/EgtB/PvdO family nonheme iron enzyme, partial [Aestuariivirgaceae bacterium]
MPKLLWVPIIAWFVAFTGPALAVGPDFGMVDIPAGSAKLGDPDGDDNEVVTIRQMPAFRMMRLEVTNAQFEKFVAATGHRTDPAGNGETYVWWNRWQRVKGVDWRRPNGPQSTIVGLDDHPVMQVSARDADAFCAYYGMRLPSDAEWEYA